MDAVIRLFVKHEVKTDEREVTRKRYEINENHPSWLDEIDGYLWLTSEEDSFAFQSEKLNQVTPIVAHPQYLAFECVVEEQFESKCLNEIYHSIDKISEKLKGR